MAMSAAQKLGIKPGMRVLVRGLPIAEAGDLVGALPAGATVVEDGDGVDLVLLFAGDLGAIRSDGRSAYELVGERGRFWIAYRKGGAELHRDTLQAAVAELGLDGVTLIALDAVWSAMRVRSRG